MESNGTFPSSAPTQETNQAAMPKLSAGAKLVLRVIEGWLAVSRKRNDLAYCWPGTRRLAEDTQLSERQVRRHLQNLEQAGKIFIYKPAGKKSLIFTSWADMQAYDDLQRELLERRVAANFPELYDDDGTEAPIVDIQDPSETPDTPDTLVIDVRTTPDIDVQGAPVIDVRTTPDTDVRTCRSSMTTPSYMLHSASNKAAVAAAASFLNLELHIEAKHFERVSPSLIEAVAAHLRERLAIPNKKPVGPGYVIGCLREPERFGFVRGPEGWRKPVEANLAAERARKQGHAKTSAALSSSCRDPAEVDFESARIRWWEALPAATQEAIREHVRGSSASPTLFADRNPDGFLFRSTCIRVAEDWHRTDKLADEIPPPPKRPAPT